eukprot:GEMP01011008.1.p1 GENE.GEMP01011008.1~~GEMP01011008.1.p1  ORF type:complete len:815 (+),score=185.99 GEMP01011008.1:377-2821(+)
MNCTWFTDEYTQIDKHLKVGRRRTLWKSSTNLKYQGLEIPSTVVKSYNFPVKRTRPDASGWSVRRGGEKKAHAKNDPDTPMQENSLTDYDLMMMDIWYSDEGFCSAEEDFHEDVEDDERMQHGVPPLGDSLAAQLCSAMQCPVEKRLPKMDVTQKSLPKMDDMDEQELSPSALLSADNAIRVLPLSLFSHQTTIPCVCWNPHSLMSHDGVLETSLDELEQTHQKLEKCLVKLPAETNKAATTTPSQPTDQQPKSALLVLADLGIVATSLFTLPPLVTREIWPDAMLRTLTTLMQDKNIVSPWSSVSLQSSTVPPSPSFSAGVGAPLSVMPRSAESPEPSQCQLCVFDASKFALTKWVAAKDLVSSSSDICVSSGVSTPEQHSELNSASAPAPAVGQLTSGITTRRALRTKAIMPSPKTSLWGMNNVIFTRAKNSAVPKNRSIDFTKIRNHVVATNRIVKAKAKALKRQARRTVKREGAAKLVLAAMLAAAKESITLASILCTTPTINSPSLAPTVTDFVDAKMDNVKEDDNFVGTHKKNTTSPQKPLTGSSKKKERAYAENTAEAGVASTFARATVRAAKRQRVAKRALAMVQKMQAATKEMTAAPVAAPPVTTTTVKGPPPVCAVIDVTPLSEGASMYDMEIAASLFRATKKAHHRRGKGAQSQEKSCKRVKLSCTMDGAPEPTPTYLVWEYEMERQREFWASTSYEMFVSEAKLSISPGCECGPANAVECIPVSVEKCVPANAEECSPVSVEECGSVNAEECVEELSLTPSERVCDDISAESGYGSDMVLVEMDELEGVNEDDWILLEGECA